MEQISLDVMDALAKVTSIEFKERLISFIGAEIMNVKENKEAFIKKGGLELINAIYLLEQFSVKSRARSLLIIYDLLKSGISIKLDNFNNKMVFI